MKSQIFFLILLFLWSCKKTPVEEKSEIDFTSTDYFTASVLKTKKILVKCDETAYWEGKSIKLTGFVQDFNINTSKKTFFLHDGSDLTASSIVVNYESKDSLQITQLLLNNKNKSCNVKVTCETLQDIFVGCAKIVIFMIKKPEDLVFK